MHERSTIRRIAGLSRAKKIAILTVGTVAISGTAFAYWTQSGNGTGTAATTTTVGITVNQTSTVSGLGPGTAAQPLSGNFTNTNTSKVYVSTVTITVSGTNKTGCDATDYTIANSPVTVNAEIPSGTAVGAWGGGAGGPTISFNNKSGTNQDACKGATVNLSYSSS